MKRKARSAENVNFELWYRDYCYLIVAYRDETFRISAPSVEIHRRSEAIMILSNKLGKVWKYYDVSAHVGASSTCSSS